MNAVNMTHHITFCEKGKTQGNGKEPLKAPVRIGRALAPSANDPGHPIEWNINPATLRDGVFFTSPYDPDAVDVPVVEGKPRPILCVLFEEKRSPDQPKAYPIEIAVVWRRKQEGREKGGVFEWKLSPKGLGAGDYFLAEPDWEVNHERG